MENLIKNIQNAANGKPYIVNKKESLTKDIQNASDGKPYIIDTAILEYKEETGDVIEVAAEIFVALKNNKIKKYYLTEDLLKDFKEWLAMERWKNL